MKSIFTFLAFLLACSVLLSTIEETEGVGFILEIARPSRSNRTKKNVRKKKDTNSKKFNRHLKHQMKKVLKSIRKTRHNEAVLRRMLYTVSFNVHFSLY